MANYFKNMILFRIFRVILFFLLLEIFLRMGGWIFLWTQDLRNKSSLGANSEIRILCLGESITALGGEDSYPSQLEKVLNAKHKGKTFRVINKGIPSVTTTLIRSRLPSYIDEFKPQIVTAMIGINDTKDLGAGIIPEKSILEKINVFAMSKKLISQAINHTDQKQLNNQKESDPIDPQIKLILEKLEEATKKFPNAKNYMELAKLYRVLNNLAKEKENFLKALEFDPKNYQAYGYLGLHYRQLGEFDKAVDSFQQMLKYAPNESRLKIEAYAYLAEAYRLWEKFDKAEETYRASIDFYAKQYPEQPGHPFAYAGLGEMYWQLKKFDEAEALFKKEISINPQVIPSIYSKLANCYHRKGAITAAEKLLIEGLKVLPESLLLYIDLSSYLLEEKKYAGAEKVLTMASSIKPDSLDPLFVTYYTNLLKSFEGQGKSEEAAKARQVLDSEQKNFNQETKLNYLKIKTMLAEKNIQLVAVQYPMRSLNPLKAMLNDDKDIWFVDNETSFKNGIASEGFESYFIDRISGDSGHCTAKGNRLIAENIAKVILQNY